MKRLKTPEITLEGSVSLFLSETENLPPIEIGSEYDPFAEVLAYDVSDA